MACKQILTNHRDWCRLGIFLTLQVTNISRLWKSKIIDSKVPTVGNILDWLVVSTYLKNISQNGNLPQIGVKIQIVWNHHLVEDVSSGICFFLGICWIHGCNLQVEITLHSQLPQIEGQATPLGRCPLVSDNEKLMFKASVDLKKNTSWSQPSVEVGSWWLVYSWQLVVDGSRTSIIKYFRSFTVVKPHWRPMKSMFSP